MSARLRPVRLIGLAIVGSLVLAGCVQQPTELATPAAATGPQPGGVPVEWQTGKVGDTFSTARGSKVTVHGFDPSVQLSDGASVSAADVEACAGSQAARVRLGFFLLEVQDEQVRPPRDVEGLLKDNLEAQPIESRECARGWVAFATQPADDPVAVLLAASSFIRWVRGAAGG